jgi:hypothetical protein
MKFMKKIALALLIVFSMIFSLNSKTAFATNCHNYGGATTYCDDGTSYSNYGGSTTYGSDGTSYSNYGGATTYGSDGSTQSNYGGSTTYSNDGTSYSDYGGSTTYGSDGSTYNDYGGSTTYGSGSGKMIKIPNQKDSIQSNYGGINEKSLESGINCPLNSSYDSLSSSCKCNYGYVASGSSCIYKSNDNSDTIKAPSYLPSQQKDEPETDTTLPITNSENPNSSNLIPSSDTNPSNTQYNQDSLSINQKNEDKESDFAWWNPLAWWNHFFNKSTPATNDEKPGIAKLTENETHTPSLEWKEYTSDIGKFKALFPYAVIHDDWMDSATMKKLGWNGINKIDTFSTSGTNDLSFSVWFHQYTNQNNTADKSTLQKSLNNLLNLMKKDNYGLVSAGYSKYGEYNALDYLIFSKEKNKYEKGRFIAVKQNVYQIFVDYKGDSENADIVKFFDSLNFQ